MTLLLKEERMNLVSYAENSSVLKLIVLMVIHILEIICMSILVASGLVGYAENDG